jgi:hypothetical protein
VCAHPHRKATGSLKIVHEVYSKNPGLADQLREDLGTAMQFNEQLGQCVGECVRCVLLLSCLWQGFRARGM